MLGSKLEIAGCTILYAKRDADTMIVKAAVECSLQINSIEVGDDTDLLVLLCYHCEFSSHDVFTTMLLLLINSKGSFICTIPHTG